MREDARNYRRSMATNIPNHRQNGSHNRDSIKQTERYTASKGTAHRKSKVAKNNKRKLKLKIASLLLAAGIGIGGITVLGGLHTSKEPAPTITKMQENGISPSKLGLEADTIDTMKKLDAYFANFDSNNLDLSENELINMINEVEDVNFNVLKDKIANIKGLDRSDVSLYYKFDNGDGKYYTSITTNKDEYGKEETYSNNINPINKSDSIPENVSDLIVQIDQYESLIEDVKTDRISKVNAVNKLKELYDKISNLATLEFTVDEKGNITTEEYNLNENQKSANTEHEER